MPASRIKGSVVRQTAGVVKFYNSAQQLPRQAIDTFRDQLKPADELNRREAQSTQPKYRLDTETLPVFNVAMGHGNNVAQLEAQYPEARAGATKRREAAKMIEQNRKPFDKILGGIESRQRNTCSSQGKFKADVTRSMIPSDVLEIREPELLSRDEEGQCTAVSGEGVTENSVSLPLRAQELLSKALWMDGGSVPARVEGGLTGCGTGDGSTDGAQGNGRRHIHRTDTTSETIAVLKARVQRGITIDAYAFVKVLQMCLKQKDLVAMKQVHDCIIESRMERNTYVASTLLSLYIKCGGLLDARRVFDKLGKKNVITWNIMIAGYAKSHRPKFALELFKTMRQEAARPNQVTYLCVLKACGSPLGLKWGKEIHKCIQNAGFESDVRVGSALVHMYAEGGSIDDARLVFDRMQKRNVVTWNTMIGGLAKHGHGHEAYRLFLQMKHEGFEPNSITYLSILNASASAGALEWVKEVHGHVLKAGLESDVRVGSALVHLYAESGSIDDAQLVFDRMQKRDVVTWTIMIRILAQHGRVNEAYRLFLQMKDEGCEPDAFLYASILNACADVGAVEWVKEVHGHARKAGLESDVRVGSALVHLYAESGSLDGARLVFDRMQKRDAATWNIMIGGLAKHGHGHEAYQLFLQMEDKGFEPNAITYLSILNASGSAGSLAWTKEIHGHAREAGLDSDVRVGNALVHIFAEGGSIDDARLVFKGMQKRDIVTWNTMIGALAQHGCGYEALELFRKMIADLVKVNEITFLAVLSACCHGGLLEDGRRHFSAMTQEYEIEPNMKHYNSMVDLCGRAGHLEEAKLFLSEMPVEPDVVTWKTLLGACRIHGSVEMGELAAKEVFKLDPNHAAAYLLLANIYAAAGKSEEVAFVRTLMRKIGIRKDPGRSWIEVDNRIHKFGVGDKCHPEAKAIYTYLEELTKTLKSEGYIPDTQLVLENVDEESKELALCSHSERLAIAYGLMRRPQGEPIRIHKNLRVCPDCHTATKLISKVTGREIIARDANRFHHFKDGVCSCGDYW